VNENRKKKFNRTTQSAVLALLPISAVFLAEKKV